MKLRSFFIASLLCVATVSLTAQDMVTLPTQIKISPGVAAGMVLEKVQPQYPPEAKAEHVSGTVVLYARISKTGTVESLNVVLGPALLQQAALDAVKKWRYKPYLLNGEPVEVVTTINVVFQLG